MVLQKVWLISMAVVLTGIAHVLAQTWVEDSFEDFADGRLDAAGQNLYVSRSGNIRTIHRFDLNGDGHLDLIFNSTHDTFAYIPSTVCTVSKDRDMEVGSLAVEGTRRVAVSDLNRDGYEDLVFCPSASGIQHRRRFLTVLFGDETGWAAHRATGALPVYGPTDVEVADLNADGWPDILCLNESAWRAGQPDGRIIRIFWGGERGFSLIHATDIGVGGAVEMTAGDFDVDGATDIAILTSDGSIKMLWAESTSKVEISDGPHVGKASTAIAADFNNDGHVDLVASNAQDTVYLLPITGGRRWGQVIEIKSFGASQLAAADIDDDGHADLVLTKLLLGQAMGGEAAGAQVGNEPSIHILWGSQEGFSKELTTTLKVANAAATAIGDLDGDGRADLAVGVHQGTVSFEAQSRIFFGTGDRQFVADQTPITTQGASDVAIVAARKGQAGRAVFSNSRGGTLHEHVPLNVYWGGPNGFDPKRRWDIPFTSGYEASAADLNEDSFVDLIAMDSGHAGASAGHDPHLGANIFWGSADGFDIDNRRTVLRESNMAASNIADLNKDGFLDLVLGGFDSGEPGASEPLVIYYGSEDGFGKSGRVALKAEERASIAVIADLNRDDWLDIGTTCYFQQRVRIFWGGPDGFTNENKSDLDVPSADDLEAADLNRDGWLDLVAACYSDKLDQHQDAGSIIFWGSAAGFSPFNTQWLPGFTPVGLTIADWDEDGFLDLFSPHYHGEVTRESLPSYLYWGGPDGFHARRRTILIGDSAHDALAGDFNGDGRLDLAVSCHSRDGNHYTNSRVYYNDGRRFANPDVTLLPTHGSHWMWCQDMGHIYDRSFRQAYESSIFEMPAGARSGKLTFRAEVPEGTSLTFSFRAAATADKLSDQAWQTVSSGRRFSLQGSDRELQYKAVFESENGDRYPVLDRVSISLDEN